MRAVKYNYSLDINDSNQNSYEAIVQLSKDRQSIIIVKKMPNPAKQYVIQIDAQELLRIKTVIKILTQKERLRPHIGHKIRDKSAIDQFNKIGEFVEDKSKTYTELKNVQIFLQNLMKRYGIRDEEPKDNESESEDDLEELLKAEASSKNKQQLWNFSKSESSFKIDDITGIIFGGVSSRFWMYRKHFLSIDSDSKAVMPFFAW